MNRAAVFLRVAVVGVALACIGPLDTAFAAPPEVLPVSVLTKLTLPTPGAAVAVTWSPDGSRLAAASDYGTVLSVWDRNGRLVNRVRRSGEGPTLWGSIAFVDGSSKLVFPPPAGVTNSASFSVWDIKSGQIIKTEPGPQPGADYPLNRAEHFMISPDQTILAASTGAVLNYTKNVFAYDPASWRLLYATGIHPHVSSLCVFGRGRLLGLGSITSGLITVLDARTGSPVNQFPGFTRSPYGSFSLGAIAGSPSGELVLAGITGVVLYGQYIHTPMQRSWEDSIDKHAVRIFRVKNGSVLVSFSYAKSPIRQAVWDPHNRYVAFIDHADELFLWAPWRGPGFKKIVVPGMELSLAVAPDGNEIAVATASGVRVYSLSWVNHKKMN